MRGALPVIKYPLVVTASLLGGIFFTAATNGSLVWEIIGYVLFGLLALMLVNVLEKFDFKNVLHGLSLIHIYNGRGLGRQLAFGVGQFRDGLKAVSYTHLDVYKRQAKSVASRNT